MLGTLRSMSDTALIWFRNDLRIEDNSALSAAAATGLPVVALYCLDEESEGVRPLGGASRWWLHHSLEALRSRLKAKGIPLIVERGAAARIVPATARAAGARRIFWNRRYDAAGIAIDRELKSLLASDGIPAASFNGSLLVEPWEVTTKAGEPMKVFTPFWRAARARGPVAAPVRAPRNVAGAAAVEVESSIHILGLLPTGPDWSDGLKRTWIPGEEGAAARLQSFLETGLAGYADMRNRPDLNNTSGLSPHLRFGEISPRTVWHAADLAVRSGRIDASEQDLEILRAELGWREFSYHLLFHNPDLSKRNFNRRFDAFPWRRDAGALRTWARGLTGYPIVDAGMRQLWTTGWMHNRVRMIAASFLVKHLLIDWREGEAWFWDTLADADPASNSASWQWIAGSGADAAPYFRIFNPVLQGEKFDPKGDYVRRWVPELGRLPTSMIHKPWTADEGRLAAFGLKLGRDYPAPMVDHDAARRRALAAFQSLSASADAVSSE
jgi:deoxyribodipyrimidine photo-lyase